MPTLPGQKGNSWTIVVATNTSAAPVRPAWMPNATSAAQMPAICATHDTVPAAIAAATAPGRVSTALPSTTPSMSERGRGRGRRAPAA